MKNVQNVKPNKIKNFIALIIIYYSLEVVSFYVQNQIDLVVEDPLKVFKVFLPYLPRTLYFILNFN